MPLALPSRTTGSSTVYVGSLVLLCQLDAGAAAAQSTPAGTYHARAVTLELTPAGHARLSNAFGPMILGTYLVHADSVTFRDESGPVACPGTAGSYRWQVAADTLRLQLLSDSCVARRAALGRPWAPGAAPPSPAALDAVVVTAQRQTEDVQRTPVAITVLSAAHLREAAVTRPQALTYLTPGLQVGALAGGSALLYMRGVGNFSGNSLQDPTVTFNFDGVYIARPTSTSGMYFDLERIEVLKGPQGTLYGRNATGGAVNILPRRPQFGALGGELNVEVGEYGTVRADGALNVPLGDRTAIRIAAQRARHSSYMRDGTDDQDDWAGRLSLRHEATDALSIRLAADFFDQRGLGTGSTPLGTGVDNRVGISSQEGGAYYQSQRVTIAGRNWVPMPIAQYEDNRHWGLNGTIEWRTRPGALTFVGASRQSRLDMIGGASGNFVTVQEHSGQTSLEARLASTPHPRLRTLVGAFYFDEDIETPNDGFFRPWNQFNFSLQQPLSGVTSVAPFGRATWDVTDRFRATLGARYTHERKYFGGTLQSFNRICPQPPMGSGSCPNAAPFPVDAKTPPFTFPSGSPNNHTVFNPADGTVTVGFRIVSDERAQFSRTTWRSALEYDLAERALAYGSYETGFKSGGFFYSNDSQVYHPEYVGALTLGLKSRLLEDRLQVNFELFDWRYTDQQVSKISVDSRNATNLRTENVGRATIRGIEASAEYMPVLNTHLFGDVQYLSAIYDSYSYLTPLQSGPPVSGCPVGTTPNGFLIDCSGRRSPYAPEWTLTAGGAQAFPLRQGGSVTARTRARYQSETLAGIDFLPQQQQRGHAMIDASLTWTSAADRYSLGLFGQNITDRTVMSNTFVVPFSTFAVGVLRPPRTLGVRVGGRF